MEDFVERHAVLIAAFPVLWIGAIVTASAVFRRQRGKRIFATSPDSCIFEENRTSGRELGGIRALGGASNALKVCVTRDTLYVMPCFPFSLMFMPEIWGLDHEIKLRRVRTIEERSGLFGRSLVVHLADDKRIELRLRDPDGFRHAIQSAGRT
ncbi:MULTISPECIES: hypothetical protein [unclassified Brevundimonas]|jgi:hypothetical protein|uniref:hypothetical protein n=1 Tax=unclassified Brevundimonas TaxID=2622653 RepID=UPI000C53BD41|nr:MULTISPECIES: hypothetical protein [unclassified Brevundimonas]MAL88290.1 hypothetical protein [Brevundimonas sp.]HAJ04276.1 hypothetical protein [Brevundimonas sp.]HAV49359.1 hypothetical protein [Brevundimonas sp.]|tara:strand:- start:7534 stop:7992 length:459 start_codon:yes stop_codon:yes gene_type:complete